MMRTRVLAGQACGAVSAPVPRPVTRGVENSLVVVSILAVGAIEYALAARQAVQSVLDHTDFDVHVTCDQASSLLIPHSPRVRIASIEETDANHRADRFLAKLSALRRCLRNCADPIVLQLDADAVLMRQLTAAEAEAALGASGIAMVEQTTIVGSQIRRTQYLQHYTDYSLRFIAPDQAAPREADFRYYNSGVVLFRRRALEAFLDWAEDRRRQLPAHHAVGTSMIADKDYLQVWANTATPGSCRELSWDWNHCPLWDEGFPRSGARIAHLSNYCVGPDRDTIARLRTLRGTAALRPTPRYDDLTFVVVTYDSDLFLDTALSAAARLGRIVVVDNASRDRSLAIAEEWGAKIVRNDANEGFAKAANAGAAAAETRFVCFLNPDCLVTEAAAEAARAALSSNPRQLLVPDYVTWSGQRTAGAQPGYTRTKLAADMLEAGGQWTMARRLRGLRSHHDPSWSWPLAACLFVDRKIFFELGGFDARYFCYMEDVALGRRAAQNGVPTVGLPLTVLHLEGQGAAVSPASRNMILDTARRQFAREAYGAAFVLVVRVARRLLHVAREARTRVTRSISEVGS
jgi:GT2 family glycosyltransferase